MRWRTNDDGRDPHSGSPAPCGGSGVDGGAGSLNGSTRSDGAIGAGGGIGRRVARNLGWLFASRGVAAVLSLAYLAIAARSLGVTNFGRFALIVGAAQVLTTLVAFETWQIIVQFGSRHLRNRDGPGLATLLRGCAVLDAAGAVLGLLLAALILARWHDELGISETLHRATLIFAAAQLLSIRSTPLGILRLHDRFSLAALLDSVTPLVRFAGAVAAAAFHPTVQAFLAAWGAAEVLTAASYWVAIGRTSGLKRLTSGRLGLRTVARDNPGIVRFAINSNLISSLNLSSKQLPLLIAGATIGTSSAGAYRISSQLAQGLTKISQLTARAAFPEIARVVGAEGLETVKVLFRRSIALSASVGTVLFLFIALLGPSVLAIMGSGFVSAYPLLLWLAAAGCVDLITVAFEPTLVVAHRAGRVMLVRLLGACAMAAVAFALGPRIGTIGIAAGVLANSILVALLLGLLARRLLRSPAYPTAPGMIK